MNTKDVYTMYDNSMVKILKMYTMYDNSTVRILKMYTNTINPR